MKGSSLAGRFGAAKKVIFLDVDGVLHSVYVQVLKDVRRCFNPQCLKILRDVVDTTGAVVVLSSNWRLDKDGYKKVQRVMKDYGIRMIGKTCVLEGTTPQSTRVEEIMTWIRERNFKGEWIAIDDMDLMANDDERLSDSLNGHFVRTAPRGLVSDDFEKCVSLLGKKDRLKPLSTKRGMDTSTKANFEGTPPLRGMASSKSFRNAVRTSATHFTSVSSFKSTTNVKRTNFGRATSAFNI